MTLRRDPARRLVRALALVCGTALVSIDTVWMARNSPAAWLVRVALYVLVPCHIVMARGDIDRVELGEKVIARSGGTRDHFWRGVGVLFTESSAVAVRRSVIDGAIRGPLMESARDSVHLTRVRHGAFLEHVRCEWPDGTVMHLRMRPRDVERLGDSVAASPAVPSGVLSRLVDWIRAGTTYEE